MACGDREQVSVTEWGICWKWGFIPYPCRKTSIKTRYHYMFNPYRYALRVLPKEVSGLLWVLSLRMDRRLRAIRHGEWTVGVSDSRQISREHRDIDWRLPLQPAAPGGRVGKKDLWPDGEVVRLPIP
jgi:hypothetical protein